MQKDNFNSATKVSSFWGKTLFLFMILLYKHMAAKEYTPEVIV